MSSMCAHVRVSVPMHVRKPEAVQKLHFLLVTISLLHEQSTQLPVPAEPSTSHTQTLIPLPLLAFLPPLH